MELSPSRSVKDRPLGVGAVAGTIAKSPPSPKMHSLVAAAIAMEVRICQ